MAEQKPPQGKRTYPNPSAPPTHTPKVGDVVLFLGMPMKIHRVSAKDIVLRRVAHRKPLRSQSDA